MELVPPLTLIKKVGCNNAEDYQGVGRHFLNLFKEYGLLRPEDRVLDVGCGCGRIAVALPEHLTSGSYDGFDIIPELVEWCQREITSRDARFKFQQADVFNKTYHPRGRWQAKDYRFPFEDGAFDFTFLTSVFTHMLPVDVEHYVAEIVRTLKPGGRVLLTFFLLNEESLRLKDTKASRISLKKSYLNGQVLVMKRWKPEAVVGYPEQTVRALLQRHGLKIREPIMFGSWCGRVGTLSFQDVVMAERP
ncbi:MAG TPA: class I SAM-dependent methyltransferase [Phycisphaerae bacterium]|jgi:SAM-dependent methyltransferase